MDAITMNTDINMKTMSHCYKLLKKNVNDEYPNFDNVKMSENLQKMVRARVGEWCVRAGFAERE